MDELKNFSGGGMDSDSAPELIAANDYREGWNIRNSGTQEGESGYLTNIESMTAIEVTRPSGLSKTIGASGIETNRAIFAFHYNSQNRHQITVTNYDTEEERVIFTNIIDTGGVDLLRLNPKERICDIKLINDKFLVFTDGIEQLCYLDYQKLISGGYGTITKDDLVLIKAQPMKIPKAVFANDGTRSVNSLAKKLFQFAYFYTYEQYEESTLSSYSKRLVPIRESTAAVGTDVTKSNVLLVSANIGGNRIKSINLAARYDNLDWFIISSIDREKVLTLPGSINFELSDREAYNPITNEYTLAFYNDGLYTNLDSLFIDSPYDYVPLKAGSVEVIDNILALGDITEGYDRPKVDVSFSVTSYDPGIKNPAPDTTNDLRARFEYGYNYSDRDDPYTNNEIYFNGLPKTGDKISVVMANNDGEVYNTFTYPVPITENDNLMQVARSLGAFMIYPWSVDTFPGEDTVVLRFSGRRRSETPDGRIEVIKNVVLDLANTGTGLSTSIPALKTNSSYQLALAHYDKYGRYFPITTDNGYVLKTQSYAQIKGNTPIINWGISSKPPKDAASYQWLLSSNNTSESSLYTVGKVDTLRSTSDYFVFNINPLKKFNEANSSSILNYDYSQGDRVTLIFYKDGANTNWFENPAADVEVVSFDIVVDAAPDPDVTNFLLKVRKPSTVNIGSITNKDVFMEIYTPKKRTETVDGNIQYASTVFFEIGEQFLIENGEYTIKSGTITDGDVYFKTREIARATDTNNSDSYVVESFHFSDYYKSNYYSFGRQRTYYDTPENIRSKASIRYSDPFIPGSKTNGLTRFYKERIYGDQAGETSSNFGAIVKMYMRDNYLVVLQELKVGHIPVNISLLEDQASNANVAISNKLLNNIRYSQGKWGIGTARESFAASKNGDIYFIDPNNSLPVRDGANGVQPIAFKMSKYFLRTIQEANKKGYKMIGTFDDYNNEYRLFIEGDGDVLKSITLSALSFDYLEKYTVVPSSLLSTAQSNGTVSINTSTGKAMFTPTTGYTGNAGFSFSFTNNLGATITKNSCISVIPGDKSPNDIFFTPSYDNELDVLVQSNSVLVSGINIRVPISITSGSEYRVNGGSWTSLSGFVVENDVIELRGYSSEILDTENNITVTIGSRSFVFTITTIDGYYNVEKMGTFTKSDCGVGLTPSDVVYTVAAGTYVSLISQIDADQQAQDDVDANGQAYANANGVCFIEYTLTTNSSSTVDDAFLSIYDNSSQTGEPSYLDNISIGTGLTYPFTVIDDSDNITIFVTRSNPGTETINVFLNAEMTPSLIVSPTDSSGSFETGKLDIDLTFTLT